MFNALNMLQEWFDWDMQPAVSKKVSHVCVCVYVSVTIFSRKGMGHDEIWNTRHWDCQYEKNKQSCPGPFCHDGLSQEVDRSRKAQSN